ncbi:MAG: hypothetical protein HY059_20185 [Proteobacteria bacterium]|nr:hypothetical protein [Pseudomonadota bacterium]
MAIATLGPGCAGPPAQTARLPNWPSGRDTNNGRLVSAELPLGVLPRIAHPASGSPSSYCARLGLRTDYGDPTNCH